MSAAKSYRLTTGKQRYSADMCEELEKMEKKIKEGKMDMPDNDSKITK